MQSGERNTKKWILEFDTKELAINFAKKNNIEYYIIEPQKRKIVKKSYADNFIKKQ